MKAVLRLLVSNVLRERPQGWMLVGPFEGADIRLDIGKHAMPFGQGSVDAVYVERALEHVPRERVRFVLSELRRVVKSGEPTENPESAGRAFDGALVRIVAANLAEATRAYTEQDAAFFASISADLIDGGGMGERFAAWQAANGLAFDHEALLAHLRSAGFKGMYRSAANKSLLPDLRGPELDSARGDVLFVECWRAIAGSAEQGERRAA